MLQLDFLGFTTGSYAAWLYKSSHILMRTERGKGQLYTNIFANISLRNCVYFVLPHSIPCSIIFTVCSTHDISMSLLCWGDSHSYLLVLLRGEVVPYRRKIFVLGWFVSKEISWRTPRACFVLRISFVISFNVYHRPLYYAYGNIIDIGPWNCPACLPGASPQAFWSLKCLHQLNFFFANSLVCIQHFKYFVYIYQMPGSPHFATSLQIYSFPRLWPTIKVNIRVLIYSGVINFQGRWMLLAPSLHQKPKKSLTSNFRH